MHVRAMSTWVFVSTLTLGVLGAGVAAYAVTADDRAEDSAGIGTIYTSYAFDPNDKAKLMDFGDDAFIGRVTGKAKTLDDQSSTLWTVNVVDTIKGDAVGKVQVQQLGYVDQDGRLHESEDQPVLQNGKEYLLVTTDAEDGTLTLLAGSSASVLAEDDAKKSKLKQDYKQAEKAESGLIKPPRR